MAVLIAGLFVCASAVHASPLISVQPPAQAAFVGGNATLQVQAVPSSGLTYQWQVKTGGTGTAGGCQRGRL